MQSSRSCNVPPARSDQRAHEVAHLFGAVVADAGAESERGVDADVTVVERHAEQPHVDRAVDVEAVGERADADRPSQPAARAAA